MYFPSRDSVSAIVSLGGRLRRWLICYCLILAGQRLRNCAPVNVFPLQDSDSEWWFICCCLSCNRPETQNNQNQNQNQNQLYSPSLCKHTRNLLWFLRSSWYIHAYIHTYIYTYISDMRTEHLNKT